MEMLKETTFEQRCSKYKSITLTPRQMCDLELILNGGFSPLDGFMNKRDYLSCVNKMRLDNGKLWSMPITLSINDNIRYDLLHENYVVLKHDTGLPLALMDISDTKNSIYNINLKSECENVYGSNDKNHPYVKILNDAFDEGFVYNIGGKIIEYKMAPVYDFKDIRLTPNQTKEFFKKNNWDVVVGFQTRNPMHRSHYELSKYAVNEASKMEGKQARVLVHPVVGITQDCDVNYHTRVKCYKKLMPFYKEENVDAKLCLLNLSMRMAGPREAIWHAQIRKNYGCTHFVIGRDHAGPSYKKQDGSDFYGPYDAQELFMKHAEEIGIKPIVSQMIVYSVKNGDDTMNGSYQLIDNVNEETHSVMKISGTQQRYMLNKGEPIPDWFTFPPVAKELGMSFKKLHEKGLVLYFVGLSGSGKSTIANYVISAMREFTNRQITYLDGDVVRLHLSKGLDFSKEGRSANIQRIGFVSSEVAKHGGIAVAANIAPYEYDRKVNRESVEKNGGIYIEIFVNSSLDTCEKRDVKGLYKLAREGIVKEFTGISSPFENPINPEITLQGELSLETNVQKVIQYLKENKYLL